MPIAITDWDGGAGNIIEFRGIVTDREYIDVMKAHLSQEKEKFFKYKYSLIDTAAITRVDVSSEAIGYVADLCIEASKINPDPIVAFAASSDLIYGLSRMYTALINSTNWETMVYRSRKEALDWIRGRAKEKFGMEGLTFS